MSMGTTLYGNNDSSISPGELELESQSRRLAVRGGSDTPKFDATPSPFVATPSAPQRTTRRKQQRGGITYCADACASTRLDYGASGVDTQRQGDDFSITNKDLLVIALEEDNDRLRSALDLERRARQLAEARARDFEQQAVGLRSRLTELQQKLEEFEQEAFRRVMLQTWLDTATPQRRGSVDQGPEEVASGSTDAGSAVFAEARLCMKPTAPAAADGHSSAKQLNAALLACPHALDSAGGGLENDAGANMGAEARAATACAGAEAGQAGIRGALAYEAACCLDLEYGIVTDCLGLDRAAPIPPPRSEADGAASAQSLDSDGDPGFGDVAAGWSASGTSPSAMPHCAGWLAHSCCDGSAAAVSNPHLAWTAPLPPPMTAGPLQRACTLDNERGLGGGGDGLCPQWSLPLQTGAEKHRGTAMGPTLSTGQSPRRQAQLRGERVCSPPPGGSANSDEPCASAGVVPANAPVAAASVWMPAGAALCQDWGLESAPCGGAPPPLAPQQQLPAGQPGRVAAAAPLLAAWSLPSSGTHLYPYSHAPTHPTSPHQAPLPWLGCLRVPDRSRLRGSSAVLRSAFAAAAGGGGGGGYDGAVSGGGAVAGILSCGSAPVGAQDGGEWCTIPLGSPVCTHKKGNAAGTASARAGSP